MFAAFHSGALCQHCEFDLLGSVRLDADAGGRLDLHNEGADSPDGLANGSSVLKSARIAVLFSGGIDSTMLACLAHR